MPELPEVETIVRQLRGMIVGLHVGKVRVGRRDVVHGDVRPLGRVIGGREIVSVKRRAKRVVIEMGEDAGAAKGRAGAIDRVQVVFHLGMSGRLGVHEVGHDVETHTHVRIGFEGGLVELRFRDPRRFGGVWCLSEGSAYRGKVLGEIGPEPLTLRVKAFGELLQRRRQIKALLLDQSAIAGLGNIYCDEALFDAGIHPMARADEIDGDVAGRLLTSIKTTLRRAINHKGSTLMDYRAADGEPGAFQTLHRVYGREGKPCKRCGGAIVRLQVAGRSSFVCERCQAL